MKNTKFYELKKGDKADHGFGIDTFIKMDGMYGQWEDAQGKLRLGHFGEYELKDGIYYPICNQ